MGLLLLPILAISIIVFLTQCSDTDYKLKHNIKTSVIVSSNFSIAWACVFSIVVLISYLNYVSLLETRASISQDIAALNLYRNAAILEFRNVQGTVAEGNKVVSLSSEITDLKYMGYQDKISGKIERLRKKVVSYNENIVGKDTMKRNWFFNWCIVAPEGSIKPINIDNLISKH